MYTFYSFVFICCMYVCVVENVYQNNTGNNGSNSYQVILISIDTLFPIIIRIYVLYILLSVLCATDELFLHDGQLSFVGGDLAGLVDPARVHQPAREGDHRRRSLHLLRPRPRQWMLHQKWGR